jgi:hypothetical protein
MEAREDGPAFGRATPPCLVATIAWLLASSAPAQLLPVDVIGQSEVDSTHGGLPPPFLGACAFGTSVARLGDLDGDGLPSVVVGAPADNSIGALWVLELEADGDVVAATRIGPEPFGMGTALHVGDQFGRSVDALGDVDGDGVTDLAVGAPGDESGALWILFLTDEGGLKGTARITGTTPGFCASLLSTDQFGTSVAALGDRNGDGTPDVAVGVPNLDASDTGAVLLLSLTPAGGLAGCTRIASGENGMAALDAADRFGSALAVPGDLDGDGDLELAVGATGDDDGSINSGAVWVLSIDASGQVSSTAKLSATSGGFGGAVSSSNPMGGAVGALGDVDGDGIGDLAVGLPGADDGGNNAGAVWILFLQGDATISSQQKLSNTSGGFGGLVSSAAFGTGLPPSLRGEAQPLCAGTPGGGLPGETSKGCVWRITLTPAGTVATAARVGVGTPGLNGGIEAGDSFGFAAAKLGDLDGDGLEEFAIGASADDDGFAGGALWTLELDAQGSIASPATKLSATQGGLLGVLSGTTAFGSAVVPLGDLSGDGTLEVAVGGPGDDSGDTNIGAIWVLSFDASGNLAAQSKVGALSPGLPTGALSTGDGFGSSLAAPGDLDGDGVPDLLVGAPFDDDVGDTGAVWVLLLTPAGGLKTTHKLSATQGGLGGGLATGDRFGAAIAVFGDTDGDGRVEIAVGAPGADDAGASSGSIWILELGLGGAGTSSAFELNAVTGGLQGAVVVSALGSALSTLTDVDADGRPELVVGVPGADLGASNAGAVAVFSLRPDGSVRDQRVLGLASGGFGGALQASDSFGSAVAPAGDFDDNGATDLLVGATGGGAPVGAGAVWVLRLMRSPWSPLGQGLQGLHGVPVIAALGSLAPGTPLRFELSEARRYAPCWLILGTTELDAPFKGGVIVPYPALVVPETTDGFGFKSFGGTWPAGVPAGSTLYAQWWIMDAHSLGGLSATPGAKGVVP